MELSKIWCVIVLGLIVVGCASKSSYQPLTTTIDVNGQRWVMYDNEQGQHRMMTEAQWKAGKSADEQEADTTPTVTSRIGRVVLMGIAGLAQPDPPQTFHRRGNYICDQNEICVGGNQVQPH